MTTRLVRVPGPDTALRLLRLVTSTALWQLGAAATLTLLGQ
jgi:hypothetical protein